MDASHRPDPLQSPQYGPLALWSECGRSTQLSLRPFPASLAGLSAKAWLFLGIARPKAAGFSAGLPDLDALTPSR